MARQTKTVFLATIHYLDRQPPAFSATVSLILIFAIAVIDYVIPWDLSLSVFYTVPILLATWFAGERIGAILSVGSAAVWLMTQTLEHADLSWLLYWNTAVHLGFYILVAHLVSALESAYEREKRLARTDSLTGIINRRFFNELLEGEFSRAQRYSSPLTLAYIDVDHFKSVNDRFGHQAGDLLLTKIAQCMTSQLRSIDVVARLGGDEFVLMLPQTGRRASQVVVPRLQEALMELMVREGWPVSFSIGVATFLDLPESVDSMVQQADQLMYSVKSTGKNRIEYAVFEAEVPELILQR
jgi:diguanylate cyclase (GGDEF)-like protein